jgi:cyclase
LLDIHASRNKTAPNFGLVSEIASECFMPLCYGGGIRTLDDAEKLFSMGVEKISIQTSALKDLNIVNRISSKFGAQAVVVSLDIKRDFFGKAKLYSSASKETVNFDWLHFSKSAIDAGAGEIFINSVDKDGTLSGPDIQLVEDAAGNLSTPLTYAGGVSSLSDIKMIIKAGASAVAAGAFFVFNGPNRAVLISYPRYSEIKNLFI